MKRLLMVMGMLVALSEIAEAAVFTARATAVYGVVTLARGGKTSYLRQGTELAPGDCLKVQKGSVVLSWPDGTQARLVAGTEVTLDQSRTRGVPEGTLTLAKVQQGRYWLNVSKYARRPARFEVDTGRTMGAVEGTQVMYEYTPDSAVSVMQVWTGKVQCYIHAGTMDKLCRKVESGWTHTHRQDQEPMDSHGLMAPMGEAPWEGTRDTADPGDDPDMTPWP